MPWLSTKTYTHEEGLSCAFRQWRAKSHCRLLHGYALSFSFKFQANELDERNWCVDFGGLKELKKWLHDTFDHKLCVAIDDPELNALRALRDKGLAELTILESVGCEKFAELAHCKAKELIDEEYSGRVSVVSVEVREHGGNSGIFTYLLNRG